MPAKSERQARLMRAAAHGADFPLAKKVRASMTPEQMADFSQTAKAQAVKPSGESHAYNWRSRKNLKRGR